MSLLRPGWKTLVGVLHLGPLPGQPGFQGIAALLEAVLRDVTALEAGGIDALLVENFADRSPGPFVGPDAVAAVTAVTAAVVRATRLPVGVNVLPNDHRAAFAVAAATLASFVQLDVFVDRVRTDYTYSDAPPFEVEVDVADVARERRRVAPGVLLWATVHPKHYLLLDGRSLEESTRAAVAHGADAVVVTGAATGSAPDRARVARAAAAAAGVPVLVGSGLTPGNAADLLADAAGAIVGTALRGPGLGPVVQAQVERLVSAVRSTR